MNNVDQRINYGPVLENIVYQYAYIKVAMTIMNSKKTEDREYTPLESIKDGYPKYLLTRNGIKYVNISALMKEEKMFE